MNGAKAKDGGCDYDQKSVGDGGSVHGGAVLAGGGGACAVGVRRGGVSVACRIAVYAYGGI